tara:strand:+ start:16981 stop:17790 length:810 start_codon:yes stop_codon:yes gene_type:complete
MTSISRRLSTIILRILHARLVAAAELDAHSLLLECYHPSARLFEPALHCAYLGTDGLSAYQTSNDDDANIGARLERMRGMYSRFRPHQREYEEGGRRVVRRPGDVPGSRTFPGTAQDNFQGETVKQTLSLESHELFTQLVAQTNLVKTGPRHGLFTCFQDVEEGVLRVWKDWLGDMAVRPSSNTLQDDVNNRHEDKERAQDISEVPDMDDARILWVSPSKNTGIRFNVKEMRFRRDNPILVRVDEDVPISYEIEYDGMRLLLQCKLPER